MSIRTHILPAALLGALLLPISAGACSNVPPTPGSASTLKESREVPRYVPENPRQFSIDRLIRDLQHVNAEVRKVSLDEIPRRGAGDKEVVSALFEALSDPWARGDAVHLLDRIDADITPVLPALCETLRNPKWGTKQRVMPLIVKGGKAAVPLVIPLLSDKHYQTRGCAAEILGEIGSDAKAAVPALIKALKDDNDSIKRRAATALARIGRIGKEGTEALVRLAADSSGDVRSYAVIALGTAGREGQDVLPELTKLLKDEYPPVAITAAREILKLKPGDKDATATLSARLQSEHMYVREDAARAIGTLGDAGKPLLPLLRKAAKDKEYFVRTCANVAIAKIVPGDKEAIRALLYETEVGRRGESRIEDPSRELITVGEGVIPFLPEALKNGSDKVRTRAAMTAWHFRDKAKVCVPQLIENLGHRDRGVTYRCAVALSAMGKETIPALRKALDEGDERTRAAAVKAIGGIYPREKAAVPSLVKALGDQSEEVRKQAIVSLRRFPPQVAQAAAPGLRKALAVEKLRYDAAKTLKSINAVTEADVAYLVKLIEDEPGRRWKTLLAIGALGEEAGPAVPSLAGILSARQETHHVLRALRAIGPAASEAIPALAECLNDEDPTTRCYAVMSLGNIGPAAKETLPAMARLISDYKTAVRQRLIVALMMIDENSGETRGALYKALQDDEADIRRDAIRALWRVAGKERRAVSAVSERLEDSARNVLSVALRYLAACGPAAREALPRIRELTKHDNSNIRGAAEFALSAIER